MTLLSTNDIPKSPIEELADSKIDKKQNGRHNFKVTFEVSIT